MSNKTWFLDSIRRLAFEALMDTDLSPVTKAGILGYYMGQLDGAGVIVEGDPEFFKACCELRDELKQIRDKIE